MSRRLSELLVVSIEQALAAPYCTSRLADAGARVIKVERNEGDFARRYDDMLNGCSSWFAWLNRGKESIVLDFKNPSDASLLRKIIGKADIFVQNLSPGATERAGFGSADLRGEFPSLVTCDISGYGVEGPYRDVPAYDFLVQCESGVASVTGTSEEAARVGVSVCDLTAGLNAYGSILEAIITRMSSGYGDGIHVSLFDGMADWMNVARLHQQNYGRPPERMGLSHSLIAPYGAYPVGGGGNIVIAIQNDREWGRFASNVLGDKLLVSDSRFINNAARVKNRGEMDAIIKNVFEKYNLSNLCKILLDERIAFGRLNDALALSQHPQLRTIPLKLPDGEVLEIIAPPSRFDSGDSVLGPVPSLGEHSEKIRREFK